jgi:hypothetical protein
VAIEKVGEHHLEHLGERHARAAPGQERLHLLELLHELLAREKLHGQLRFDNPSTPGAGSGGIRT